MFNEMYLVYLFQSDHENAMLCYSVKFLSINFIELSIRFNVLNFFYLEDLAKSNLIFLTL